MRKSDRTSPLAWLAMAAGAAGLYLWYRADTRAIVNNSQGTSVPVYANADNQSSVVARIPNGSEIIIRQKVYSGDNVHFWLAVDVAGGARGWVPGIYAPGAA